VFPIVRAGVQHAEVGRGGMVEELRDVVVGVGVGVLGARGVGIGQFGGEPDQLVGRLVGDGVVSLAPGAFVAVGDAGLRAPEFDPALGAGRLVGVGTGAAHHHVDDR